MTKADYLSKSLKAVYVFLALDNDIITVVIIMKTVVTIDKLKMEAKIWFKIKCVSKLPFHCFRAFLCHEELQRDVLHDRDRGHGA